MLVLIGGLLIHYIHRGNIHMYFKTKTKTYFYGLVRLARSGQVRSGQVRSGQVRSGQARPGQARPGQARPGMVRLGQDGLG